MVEFSFVLEVQDLDIHEESVIDACFEAGLDDALLYSSCGRSMMGFMRKAQSYDAAISSALEDILKVRKHIAVFLNDQCIYPTSIRSIYDEWMPSKQ
jgi:hypothetical protein